MTTEWDAPLACGAEPADLIEQVADGVEGPSVHQSGCPHCTAALAQLQQLWDVLDELAAEHVDVPDYDGVVRRTIRRDMFVTEAVRVFGGIVPRLARAFLAYFGSGRA